MQKKFIALFLLIALIGSGFSQFAVYLGFQLNQDYIAKTLCVNKNRPELHCNGRCYLMSKLKLVNEKEKKQAAKDTLNRMATSFLHRVYTTSLQAPTAAFIAKHSTHYKFTYYSQYITTVFRPPKVAA